MLEINAMHRGRRILTPMPSEPQSTPSSTAEWLAQHPPPPQRFTRTLASVAREAIGGADFRFAVREFLDQFAFRPDAASKTAAIEERPPLVGDVRFDAFLGALAEHLSLHHDLARPAWSLEAGRFLDRFWFVSEVPGLRAISLAQSLAAFRRRGIFIPERSLERV